MALVNPLFWAMTIVWYTQQPDGIALLFPPSVFYVALFCFLIGNAAVVYMNLLTTRIMRRPGLMAAALAVPLYWVMMSAAAAKAVFQLVCTPFYWEKTSHGLDDQPAPANGQAAA